MNFQTFKNKTALTLGNLHSGSPFYSELGDWVNEGLDEIQKLAITSGGDNPIQGVETEWTDNTIAGQSDYAIPTTLLAVRHLYQFEGDTSPDLDTDSGIPVTFVDRETFFLIDRDSTVTGYPRLYTRAGNNLRLWPTPSASDLTAIMIIGVKKDSQLVNNNDVPVMDDIWHNAALEMSIAIGARRMGWYDEAEEHERAAQRMIVSARNVQALELVDNVSAVGVADPFERSQVYGGRW